jgi:hypothetical protein
MTPERRAEMGHYRQLAINVEAQLHLTRRVCSNKRSRVDSGDAMLEDTECPSSGHHLCTNRRTVSDCPSEMEPSLTISGNSAPLSSAVTKKLVPCSHLKPITVTNANLRSGSVSMLRTFQQHTGQSNSFLVTEPAQQHLAQREIENENVTLGTRGTDGSWLKIQDSSVQNSEIKGVLKVSDKCDSQNMEQNSGVSVTDDIYRENISGASDNQQWPEKTLNDDDVNENLVQSKNGTHHCLTGNLITPIIHSVELNSPSLLSGTDDRGQKYGSGDSISGSRSDCVNCKVFTPQIEVNSENPLEHAPEINSILLLHSQKAEKLNVPVLDIPCLSNRADTADDKSKHAEIREGVMDISKGVQSESCNCEDSLRFNVWESDVRVLMNKYNILKHNSSGSTEFSGLADGSSSTPHLLIHENLEDSVSSAAMTSSTDLNNYMNITGSTSSGSPGRDAATLHNCKWSGQDVVQSASDKATVQKSSSGKNVQSLIFSESNLILDHSSLTGQTEAQKYEQNFVDDKVGTGSNKDSVCVVEKLVVQYDLPGDLKVGSTKGCPVDMDFAVHTTKTFNEKNINCNVLDEADCLTVPKLKLQHKFLDEHDYSKMAVTPVNKCVRDSDDIEGNVKKTNECRILKPEATPPKLVRQKSYTLDAPSPLLVAHMKTKKGNSSVHDMTKSSCISPKPRRKAWDITKTEIKRGSNKKKGKPLFGLSSEKARSGKRIQSSVHASLTGNQDHISSLPASNTSSPVKLQARFASLDCLPSAVSTEPVKTFLKPSTPRKCKGSFKDITSSIATKKTNRPRTSQNKSPTNVLRKDSSMENMCASSQENLLKISQAQFMPASSQQGIQGLILRLQSEHSQQMADLLAKQRKEQEELREAFVRQQNELHNIYSTAFYAPESHKILAQETSHLASHKNESLNSSISSTPSGLFSKSVSLGSANTLETTHDMHSKCIVSGKNLETFQTSISATVEKNQNVADNSLCEDLLLGKMQSSNNMTAVLGESSHENVSVKEVKQNSLQNYSPLRVSESDTAETHHLIYSPHRNVTASMRTQVLGPLEPDLLQDHNSDSGEENAKNKLDNNCTVVPLSPTSLQIVSNIPALETVALRGNMIHSLQRGQVDVSHSSVPSSTPVHECNSIDAEGRHDSIQGQSSCVRQLFPAHEGSGALHHIAPLTISELENVSIVF